MSLRPRQSGMFADGKLQRSGAQAAAMKQANSNRQEAQQCAMAAVKMEPKKR